MNVLVYAGAGTTVESVAQCTATLRTLLSPNYAVLTIDSEALMCEPWQQSTSLVAIPGGADLPYCRALNGEGNAKIKAFVRKGGAFLGFCAGGYYGSARVEFEEHDPTYAVVGSRELGFYPGTARGTAFPGFVYDSESGARAVRLRVNREALPYLRIPEDVDDTDDETFEFASYYNGGGLFADADKKDVTVLARYCDATKVEGGDAAIVHIAVGSGGAILTGPHPEFSPKRLRKTDPNLPPFYGDMVQRLLSDSSRRIEFLKAMLRKLKLKVNETVTEDSAPVITPIHVTSVYPESIKALWGTLTSASGLLVKDEKSGKLTHTGENDTFVYSTALDSPFDLSQLKESLSSDVEEEQQDDLNKVIKQVRIYDDFEKPWPSLRDTPYFDHGLYYRQLAPPGLKPQTFGSIIGYAEVVTSTSTMLDKNLSILRNLPTGYTNVGTVQVAGRGRGGNVWVSPIGLLAFSIVIRHPIAIQAQAPLVFIQYIASLAIVEAVNTYGQGYDDLGVRLKWPNDVYARNPAYDAAKAAHEQPLPPEYLKIAGILVNSNYSDGEYLLVVGCGINTANEAPSISLNALVAALNIARRRKAQSGLTPFKMEILLARIMRLFEAMYTVFKVEGFRSFEDLYYSRWLHSNAVVQLDMYDSARARILGISTDYGMLVVEEISRDGAPTGRRYTLQPDGNSFDMMKGLLKKKVT
ncbi:biotin-protein ligase [Limtongia smithiae]|uniref:biotin-protein ligase n=1 Tax=Limtongia smithiae TaxID=1125753 RepID=UPI0034CDD59F